MQEHQCILVQRRQVTSRSNGNVFELSRADPIVLSHLQLRNCLIKAWHFRPIQLTQENTHKRKEAVLFCVWTYKSASIQIGTWSHNATVETKRCATVTKIPITKISLFSIRFNIFFLNFCRLFPKTLSRLLWLYCFLFEVVLFPFSFETCKPAEQRKWMELGDQLISWLVLIIE